MEGCKKGQRNCQDMLYQQFSGRLLGVCIRYVNNRMEAEDILHDAFIKIYKNIRNFNPVANGSLPAWMRRVTVNTALNHLRDNHKYSNELNMEQYDVPDNLSIEDAEEEMPALKPEELLSIIQSLPEGYKLVFNLFVMEEYSHQEIAELMGISVNTSKTQLHKARRLLKTKIMEKSKKTLASLTA